MPPVARADRPPMRRSPRRMTSPLASPAAARPHLDAYRARLERRRQEMARLSSWDAAIGWGRLLMFGAAVALGWLVFKGRVEGGWLAVPGGRLPGVGGAARSRDQGARARRADRQALRRRHRPHRGSLARDRRTQPALRPTRATSTRPTWTCSGPARSSSGCPWRAPRWGKRRWRRGSRGPPPSRWCAAARRRSAISGRGSISARTWACSAWTSGPR